MLPKRTRKQLSRIHAMIARERPPYDPLEHKAELRAALDAAGPLTALVFEEGDCDPPYYTRHTALVRTPTLQELLRFERANARSDASLVQVRAPTDRELRCHPTDYRLKGTRPDGTYRY